MGIGFRELTAKAGDIGFRVVTSLKAGADFKKIKCQQKKGLQPQAFLYLKFKQIIVSLLCNDPAICCCR